MKKLALLVSLALVAGVAGADDATKPASAPEAVKAAEAKGKTHEVAAEIVAVDTEKGTLTLKGEKENKTVPVDSKVALKDVKAGDKVTLTCWDDEKGAHQKVVAIAPVKK